MMTDTIETRQPMSIDDILAQCMEKLSVDTPTDMLRQVFYITDRLAALEAVPTPLLTVTADGQIMLRPDLSVRGLVGIIEALERLPLAASK